MKTHEFIIAIVLALVLGVLIEVGGTFIALFLGVSFGHGILLHFWSRLHRPILRLVMLFFPMGGHSAYEAVIFYHIFCVCAWAALAFAGIWMYHRFYMEPGEKD